MRRIVGLWPVIFALLLSLPVMAGTPGSFRGVLREGASTKPGWMYVEGYNDTLRLVKVSGASISYAEEVPEELRQPNPRESLQPGAEVRVLAELDRHGDWHAREIEIIHLAPARRASE
jgi:hypothetical protein